MMTQAQARAELARLAEGTGQKISDLTDEQIVSWIQRTLMPMPYEWGRRAVDRAIDEWPWRRWMTRGDFRRFADAATQDGVPNAGAYSQNGQSPAHDPERVARQIAQMDRWRDMDAEEYFEEVLRMQAEGRVRRLGG